ncbi:MAG: competence/damage-inducible protein A [Halodesulfurarchaeum sp.]
MDVAVVTVGDELLAGETENTNASWLARQLAQRGVTLKRIVVVPDAESAIAETVEDLAARFDAVIVTGGVGPTHDDVTMDGVARAFGRDMVDHDGAIHYFDAHESYAREDLVEGTTHLPEGAEMIPNDEGVAPGAILANVYVLPGVPAEMKAMFDRIAAEFSGERPATRVLHTEAPESSLVDLLREVRDEFDVRVGSYPDGDVRIKIQSDDPGVADNAISWLQERLDSR